MRSVEPGGVAQRPREGTGHCQIGKRPHVHLVAATRTTLHLAAIVTFAAGCSTMGNVEEAKHTTTSRHGAFEVRHYGPRVVAETRVSGTFGDAGNDAFRRLFGYISGKNRTQAKIAMTAPVAQRDAEPSSKIAMTAPVGQRLDGDAWVISFTMPDGESLATLPEPEDPRVVLRAIGPRDVAVVRFSGRWTDANIDKQTNALREWLPTQGLVAESPPEVNRYDPPFVPWFLRRNEVWLTVTKPR